MLLLLSLSIATAATAQEAPLSLTLDDALGRARQYGGMIQSANLTLRQAAEDTKQVKANRLPSATIINQYIYTEGNGTPSGTFVANDGVHVYNEQVQAHEEVFALIRRGELRRAQAAEAVAKAKVQVASRGLNATVIADYYAIAVAQRKIANAELAVSEAQHFLDITQKQEKGGEAAHSDVIKAQIDLQQRQRDLEDAKLTLEKAKIALGVFLFADFNVNYAASEDLRETAPMPAMNVFQAAALANSPDMQAATAGVQEAKYDVTVARYGYLPSFGLDVFYGIDANVLAVRGPDSRENLGYVAQATLNIPVWNWGLTRSKVKQAELRREQAQLDLALAQRTLKGNLASAYAEAQTAERQLDSLRSSVGLAAENLRLALLRYQAGEATALEVVDAQNTALTVRNAYDDGLGRYRIAIATLRTLTGSL